MKKTLLILFVLSVISGYSQFIKEGIRPAYIEGNDTIFVEFLDEVEVVAPLVFDSKRNAKRYSRLVRYVKKVYPYAKIAAFKMKEYEEVLDETTKRRERKKIMRKAEEELKEEFTDDLKGLTYMQGEILLKLIDRETQSSGYEVVKEMRGGFKASFYQGFARLFGFNLKDRYDPEGRDHEIEKIVRMIEEGKI